MKFIGTEYSLGRLTDYTENFSIGQDICQCVFLSVKLAVGLLHLCGDVIDAVSIA